MLSLLAVSHNDIIICKMPTQHAVPMDRIINKGVNEWIMAQLFRDL